MNKIPSAREVYKETKAKADTLREYAIEEIINGLIKDILEMKESGLFEAGYTTKNPFIDNSTCETICEKFAKAGYKIGYYSIISAIHFWVKWEDIKDED